MRFSVALAVLPVLVAAGPVVTRDDDGSCNTGSITCCNQVQSASDPVSQLLGGLLGIGLGSITGLIGLNCSPLSVVGIGGNSCSAQPVCCEDNSFGGLIALGCNPINLNL